MSPYKVYLCVTVYLLLAAATVLSVSGQGAARPGGQPGRISDWALAGVIWSDASLLQKVTATAAEQQPDAERQTELQQLARRADEVLSQLEQFGWKQVRRGQPTASARGERPKLGVKRYDTETPRGTDDPGLDDEKVPQRTDLDIDQYRVDDYVDETPREATNLADAREDGVEGAIAAAAGRRAIQGPNAGRISERELETRSTRVPYGDSIYDRDGFDPDVDYIAKQPLEGPGNDIPVIRPDRDEDDQINPRVPAPVIDGEDEFIANQVARHDTAPQPMDRYTTMRTRYSEDADWVQFRLDANQAFWLEIAEDPNLNVSVESILHKLKADARASWHATANDHLRAILANIAELEFAESVE